MGNKNDVKNNTGSQRGGKKKKSGNPIVEPSDAVVITQLDPLIAKQKEDASRMRASLLSCNDDVKTTKQALRNISVLRFYHQMARVIRYTEMMDKLENKMYESLDCSLDDMDNSLETSINLIAIQEKLMKNMEISEKMLQPYLTGDMFESLMETQEVFEEVKSESSLDKESRDKLRNAAQAVLTLIGDTGDSDGE